MLLCSILQGRVGKALQKAKMSASITIQETDQVLPELSISDDQILPAKAENSGLSTYKELKQSFARQIALMYYLCRSTGITMTGSQVIDYILQNAQVMMGKISGLTRCTFLAMRDSMILMPLLLRCKAKLVWAESWNRWVYAHRLSAVWATSLQAESLNPGASHDQLSTQPWSWCPQA